MYTQRAPHQHSGGTHAVLAAAELWAKACPAEPFHFNPNATKAGNWPSVAPAVVTPAEVMLSGQQIQLDRTWFGELKKACVGTHEPVVACEITSVLRCVRKVCVFNRCTLIHSYMHVVLPAMHDSSRRRLAGIDLASAAFLQRAMVGYQRLLYLIAKHPKAVQRIRFSPSPPIDLFWCAPLSCVPVLMCVCV